MRMIGSGAALAAWLMVARTAQAELTPAWAAHFALTTAGPTAVHSVVEFDGGEGERLYAANDMGMVYEFDGHGWRTIGGKFYANTSGVAAGRVYALHVHDPDGAGPTPASLYAAGSFRRVGSALDGTIVSAQNVARWNGTQWVAVGNGWAGGFAYALETFDHGDGPRLYIGGLGGPLSLQRFNPDTNVWETPSPNPLFNDNTVRVLKAFDDGSGPALFVGGDLGGAGGVVSPGVVKYTGTAWLPVGEGVNGIAYGMDVFDDGHGAALYISGAFASPTPDQVMKWSNRTLTGTNSGIHSSPSAYGPFVRTLTIGGEQSLYASGQFWSIGAGTPVDSVARFDGAAWTATGYVHGAGTATTRVAALATGGAGAAGARVLAVLDLSQRPTKVVAGTSLPLVAPTPPLIRADAVLRKLDLDGAGPAAEELYALGRFLKYAADDSVEIHHIGVWHNDGWVEFGGGLRDLSLAGDISGETLYAAAVFDDGNGPALYVGGVFSHNDGALANSLLKYDGVTWSALGAGITSAGLPGTVRSMLVYDDGSGPALYVAGSFDMADTTPAANIARWNGTAWSAVGDGLGGSVLGLMAHDDGTGMALYACGGFTTPGARIAKWDGVSWSPLGSGLNDTVNAMVTYDDGRGAKLVVTGQFTTAGGGSANRVAAWDGTAWSALGAGLGNVPGIATTVRGHSLAVHDVGNGLRLYVGGLFSSAGGSTSRAYSVAQWDGSAWSALDGGVRGYGESAPVQVSSVTSFGDALLVGGSFAMVGRDLLPCTGLAKWSVAPPFCRGDTNCDGAVTFEDIDPFVARLGCPGSGPACDTGCAWQAADVDGNGEVDFNDIDPFVARLGAVCR